MKQKEDRLETGIPGFDKLCEGGLIKDSVNLIIGNAGAGKTTFLLQYLWNGATKYDEKGLYVSFEPEIVDLYRAGKKQGMDFESINNKCTFIKFNTGMPIKEIQDKLMKIIIKENVKRVCFDSINVFMVDLPKNISLRKQIYDFLSLLKKLNVCVMVTGEADEESGTEYTLSEEITFCKYSVDAVIELYSSGISGVGDRALRISKMRMTNHVRGPQGMEISESGIKVLK
jgi:circadian clock protein KaiC